MNFFMNKKQLRNNIRISGNALIPLMLCCLMVISHTAFAQYPGGSSYSASQYQADIESTDSGGGTWGEILRMNVRIEGSRAMFRITSKKGPFYNTDSVTVRAGSHNGPVIVAGKIPPGSEAAKLQLDLNNVASFPYSFFATITNDIGYAWVGPVRISKNETAAAEPPVLRDDSQTDNGSPQRPLIDESPEKATINSIVNITVTAGRTHSDDMVRIQCTASNSDNTPDDPYRSGWIYSGDTVKIPLTFRAEGTQAIFCNTLNNYGATSSLSQRTITVTPAQNFAAPPAPRSNFAATAPSYRAEPAPPLPAPARRRISSTPAPLVKVPAQGSVNLPITLKLTAGNDPQNRDLVRIGCFAEDSDRSEDSPYLSDWLPPGGKNEGTITFSSSGKKNIYCTSYSRQGVISSSTRKTISIRFANRAPGAPKISEYPSATDPGKTTYIAVTAGTDPDGDRVKVKCSAPDSSIAGNASYLSDWVESQETVTAALSFYPSGNKKISCVTIDSKNAESEKATRRIQVYAPPQQYIPPQQYTPPRQYTPQQQYTPPQYNQGRASSDYNFSNRSSRSSSPESCGPCQKQKEDSMSSYAPEKYSMKNKIEQRESTFNRPYIPNSSGQQNMQNMYQEPEPESQPALRGRVVYKSSGSAVRNALIKVWDAMSGRAYTATSDYNGAFEFNVFPKNLNGQIQASKGPDTSVIRAVQINAARPAVVDLTIIDRAARQPTPTIQQPLPPQQQWPQQQWPSKQAAPTRNGVWQFN
ncbi:MAG: carboxypeptidase regulatory-like domain-containing protein [Candidatus Electrothrix sp. EH2]|nr:carboxypeptidase regulatory-like domain-containing protein [Candidatus Electrothrix sp. EH2]